MKIVAFAGGVGGAKFADGLAQLLSPNELAIIVNTGDDFEHLGLYISPDLDTVCYTLAGIANPTAGWGLFGDTFHVLDHLQKIGGPAWFHLGDRDLATHIQRTRRLAAGQTLSQVTRDFCSTWGVRHVILPMSDQPVRTQVITVEDGDLPFQEYFVHRNCEPKVKGFKFLGINNALPAPGLVNIIDKADLIIFCPSNPWVSIDPILAIEGIRQALIAKHVFAISPIISGQTVRGPAAKMYSEMGIIPSAAAVARHFGDLLTGFVMDQQDINLANEINMPVFTSNILMTTRDDRRRLAEDVLNLVYKS
jgi:LPPG:FO 2-phospho-L-lactate transferase